ncbi:MAG: DUF4827 domain-containing protein [Prevotella sp.]|nr:DUF4827 domain-containing protein [Prevotella sp.]
MIAVLTACNDYETYGDLKEKERNAISKFIADSSITVISEDQFIQQGQTTNLERNEFVKLDKSGVYMQIIRKGCGTELQDGESTHLVCRYSEYDIIGDTLQTLNNTAAYASYPDVMSVSRKGSTITASFVSGIMYSVYHSYSSSVPSGWIVPLNYVKVGRPQTMEEDCSKVRLIVPHTQGHAYASQNVQPYFYTITFQRES